MEILRYILVIGHFVGLASLLGGVLVQMTKIKTGEARIIPAMMHGAWTMVATGLLLVLVNEVFLDAELNNIKVAVKSVVLIGIVVLALVFKRRTTVPKWVVPTIGGLTLLNIVLAVVWR